MISTKELLSGNIITDLSIEQQHNLEDLKAKLNIVRLAWNKPMIITSGFRTIYQHRLIYSKQGNDKPPMGSSHLIGCGADCYDPYRTLQLWCEHNQDLIRKTGLWMEDFKHTPTWVHFQSKPYKSFKEGKSLWFTP